jgi:hypothetical protein
VEYSLIIKGFGFTTLQTTLLNIPSGLAMVLAITIGMMFLRRFPNHRTTIGAIGFLPSIMACFLLLFLPYSNKWGLVCQIYVISTAGVGFIMILSLCTVTVAGHTKKMTTNAIFLVGYALGQMLCTQFWKVQYRPRNTVPWIIQMMTYVCDIIFIIALRFVLSRENKRRDAAKLASGKEYEEFGYVEITREDGTIVKVKVPIQFMDITDKENQAFRYAL